MAEQESSEVAHVLDGIAEGVRNFMLASHIEHGYAWVAQQDELGKAQMQATIFATMVWLANTCDQIGVSSDFSVVLHHIRKHLNESP